MAGALFLPSAAVLVPALLVPVLVLLVYSTSPSANQFAAAVSNQHFARFFGDSFYVGIFLGTLSIAVIVTALTLMLGYPLAFSLARSRSRYKGLLLAIVMAPLLTNVIVRSIGWITILSDHGYFNEVLMRVGITQSPVVFIGTNTAVVVALTHLWLPLMVLPILNSVDAMDPSLEEAAQNLGAGAFQRFVRVILPATLPGIVAGCTLVFVLSLGAFVTPVVMGQFRVLVLPAIIYQQVRQLDWPFAAAMGMVLLATTILFVSCSTRLMMDRHGRPRQTPSIALARLGSLLTPGGAAVGQPSPPAPARKRRLPSGLSIACFLIYLFLLLPEAGVLFNAFNASPYVGAEFKGFTLQWFISAFENVNYMDSLRVSVVLAIVAMATALVAGTMASLALARYRFRGWEVVNTFLLAPLGVPHIALGIGILIVFHQVGLSSTLAGLVIAHVCITIPYVVRVVYAGLAGLGTELEEAARNLGANLLVVLARVTLPLIKGSLLSGAMLAFIVSFDEVTITLLIAGATTTTLPVRIFSAMSDSWDMAIMALSSLQILVTVVIVLALDRTVGLRRLAGTYAS